MNYFVRVKELLADLGFELNQVNEAESLVIINDEQRGIKEMVIDCEEDLLIIEQHIFDFEAAPTAEALTALLQLNREVVHGAFTLDENGKRVIFRDTLALPNLDLNELEGSINSLGLALSEHANQLLGLAKN